MNSFVVKDPIIACDIGEWCNKQLGTGAYRLDVTGLFTSNVSYCFDVFEEKDAVMFSLKWAEFA